MAAELFGSQDEGGGVDAHAVRELYKQFEVWVEPSVFQGRDTCWGCFRGSGELAGTEAMLLTDFADGSTEEE